MAPDKRLVSLDVLRGMVMILMALDHTRHYFINTPINIIDVSQNMPWLFFTRWITHFCAPVFLFLAGVSVWLMASRDNNPRAISVFLLKRGLWLIFLELILMNFFWDTTLYSVELQILWVFGISFILMSAFIFLPKVVSIVIAIAMIVFQSLLDNYHFHEPLTFTDYIMTFLYAPGEITVAKSFHVLILYNIIPWSGILLLGYGIGSIFNISPLKRQRVLILSGMLMVMGYLIVRFFNIYGDPYHWSVQKSGVIYSVMSFFNITKYPASLQFILITLGPSLILMAALENIPENWLSKIRIMGQVALFFYIIHIPIIRVISKIYRTTVKTEPGGIILYAIWILIVIILFYACKIYYEFKIARKNDPRYWWLKYL
jgi:uncharacterized membrane protein